MEFKIATYEEAWDNIWQQRLEYLSEECSFYMDQVVNNLDFELIINKISLDVSNNMIVGLSGFCGLNASMFSDCQIPDYSKGILEVSDHLDFGFAYGINDKDWSIYVNPETKWICIGKPSGLGRGVEFIRNCVAIINNSNELIALWLKPIKFPCL